MSRVLGISHSEALPYTKRMDDCIPLGDYDPEFRVSSDSGLASLSPIEDDIASDNVNLYSFSNGIPFEYRLMSWFEGKLSPFVASRPWLNRILTGFNRISCIICSLLTRPMLLLGAAHILIMVSVLNGMGAGSKVFNLLAHLIKGSVFFYYGVFAFCKALGCFADWGWAWNIKPPSTSRFINAIPSSEFVEASLILLYGSTNIFLEHLGGAGGAWSAMDLQHVSIAFLYLGCGICGVLFESKTARNLFNFSLNSIGVHNGDAYAVAPVQYRHSFNPFPAFTVFWTGALMSQHQQMTMLSTAIHMAWGYLLSAGAILRFVTYSILYIRPPESYLPSRPITEILASFCLICGGMVFCLSNAQTVEAMLHMKLSIMFVLNVSVGISILFMAWLIILLVIKGWGFKRAAIAAGSA
ncbi:hypothetical protein CANCADRAFT_32036 [Tortispora caseinolytica NRRL Y-17796]|uniref:Protein YTP1-like C-terminal domain-containing protein n=1 Tax=Tortispora caseinolytica NRRL Y-17796 TaxID=767744 RepID=A0A1E4TI40_9ASCO|nr:hypothetical protein CANCADRAFT_32036 [Tortispora caseinolytica NRRL Y-17796]